MSSPTTVSSPTQPSDPQTVTPSSPPTSTKIQPASSSSQSSEKITVLLKAVGNAPILKDKNWNVKSSDTIATLQHNLRRILRLQPSDSLFFYVNQSFSPNPDYTIGNIAICFGSGIGTSAKKLTLHYSTTQAWG
ncbi:ubiquitin-like autophagy protein apg12 domain-containing protein [Ditylenchus destructor]|nr:ubiquitin-like autophagy protein apg12 domain-containing protein [Ditylenchus destructor]